MKLLPFGVRYTSQRSIETIELWLGDNTRGEWRLDF